jgi:hypothetical protein
MSLAAGVSLFSLARRMGTSLEMINRTYGHLAPDAEAYKRDLLDAYDARRGGPINPVAVTPRQQSAEVET